MRAAARHVGKTVVSHYELRQMAPEAASTTLTAINLRPRLSVDGRKYAHWLAQDSLHSIRSTQRHLRHQDGAGSFALTRLI